MSTLAQYNIAVRYRILGWAKMTSDMKADLSNLMTDPEDQGRGAGTMLTRWGCEIADDNGVPAYAQSTPAGYQTYKKCGFEELYFIDLDLANVNREGVFRTWLMIRHAGKNKSSLRT